MAIALEFGVQDVEWIRFRERCGCHCNCSAVVVLCCAVELLGLKAWDTAGSWEAFARATGCLLMTVGSVK